MLKPNAKPKSQREFLSLLQTCFPCLVFQTTNNKEVTHANYSKATSSTMQKAREAVWEKNPVTTKATYTSLSPQPAPGPPSRLCPKQNLPVLM